MAINRKVKKESGVSKPLERYVQVIEAIASSVSGLTSRDIETMLELPKTTVNRLLNGLQKSELVVGTGRGSEYQIGDRLRRILESDAAWIVTASRRRLKALADETGETCFVARLFGSSIHSLTMESPDSSVGVYVNPGCVLPPHASASGKLLTAMQEPRLRDAILETALQKLTERTLLDREDLEREYARIREQGYAIENGEHVQGLYTIACPIVVSPGSPPLYAIGLTGPAERIGTRTLSELLERLQATAAEVSRALPGSRRREP